MKLESPHFPVPYKLLDVYIDSNYRKKINPFNIDNDLYPIKTDVLLMEYIEGISLDSFSKTTTSNILYTIIKQLMLIILVAQEKLKFTHYDLHPGNVIVKKTSTKQMNYVVNGKTYTVNTYGYLPVIIDFGLSYTSDLIYKYSPLFHTDIGIYSDRFRQFVDLKILLLGINSDIENSKFKKFVTKLYSKLDIDFKNGWDLIDQNNAIDHMIDLVYDKNTSKSRVFSEYGYICFSIIQSLCKNNNKILISGIKRAYEVFELEFSKIENEIGSVFYNIYILRNIVDIARELYDKYICDDTRELAVHFFKRYTHNIISTIAQFCRLNTINWEKLLCSLYAFSDFMNIEMDKYIIKYDIPYKLNINNDLELYLKFNDEF